MELLIKILVNVFVIAFIIAVFAAIIIKVIDLPSILEWISKVIKGKDWYSKTTTEVDGKTSGIYSAKPLQRTEEVLLEERLKMVVGNSYIVRVQVNLLTVLSKNTSHYWAPGELNRNVDFGIFGKDQKLKVVVELNGPSHIRSDRIERDRKVESMLKSAGIPVIWLRTDKDNAEWYLRQELRKKGLHIPNPNR